jgi:hypothetical protein
VWRYRPFSVNDGFIVHWRIRVNHQITLTEEGKAAIAHAMKHVGGQSSRSVILNSRFGWLEISGQLNGQEDLRRKKVPQYTININLLWPRSRSFEEEKDLFLHPGIEIRILGFSTCKLATTLTDNPATRFHKVMVMVKNLVTFKNSRMYWIHIFQMPREYIHAIRIYFCSCFPILYQLLVLSRFSLYLLVYWV